MSEKELSPEERPGYQIRRAAEVKRFLESPFWKQYLMPWLLQRSVDLGQEALGAARPARPTSDEVAQKVAGLGGKESMITEIRQELKIWLDKGDEAHKKVQRKLGGKK